MSGARARRRFQNACRKAAPSARASAVVGMPADPTTRSQLGHDQGVDARSGSLEELSSRSFDLLVVGGGIVGAAVAAHAARLGLAVALVDARDFAGGTSSASWKLIHGGIRFLRLGDVRIVRAAPHERRLLTKDWRCTRLNFSPLGVL